MERHYTIPQSPQPNSDGSQWVWFQSKNDSDRWFGVNLDSMKNHGGWPPDTLKTRLK